MPIFTVGYETCQEKCSRVEHIRQTMKYSKHIEYYEFTTSELKVKIKAINI
jgi:hypothetical protein